MIKAVKDTIPTTSHHLYITPLHHASLLFEWGDLVIYVDPSTYNGKIDFTNLLKADLIVITHEHFDHFDEIAISQVEKSDTSFIIPPSLEGNIEGEVMGYWDELSFKGIEIKAVPAYNIDKPYHPRGFGNGYLFNIGSKIVYVAGDTDCIPEMLQLGEIHIAFMPMREPYTMSVMEAAECIRMLRPRIVYPYHHGEYNPIELAKLLKDVKDIEVRVRTLY